MSLPPVESTVTKVPGGAIVQLHREPDSDAVPPQPPTAPKSTSVDLEIAAMHTIADAVAELDVNARSRVLQWTIERFGRAL